MSSRALLLDYYGHISDLIIHPQVQSMSKFYQHRRVSCLEHSFNVSYLSFYICKHLHLNYRSAARAGLLHDFFLYDWHDPGKPVNFHGYRHPYVARDNAKKYFEISLLEEKIILRHMWPFTPIPPLRPEAFIVSMVDKYCTVLELFNASRNRLAFLAAETAEVKKV